MSDQIIQVLPVDPRTLELQTYTLQDESLINSSLVDGRFGESNDYIEYFVFSLQKDLLYPVDTPAISFTDFTVTNDPNLQNKGYYSTININPVVDAAEYGFNVGEFITVYNFLKTRLSSSIDNNFFISEISSDRTEIRLDSNTIPDVIFIPLARELEAEIKASVEFYKDFYLDFGSNQLVIANNITTDLSDPTNPTILIKLYEALPNQFQVKSTCWVVEQAAESVAYQISISQVYNLPDDFISISGPNTNLNVKTETNNSTDYQNFSSLTQTTVSGSFNQLDSLLQEKGIEINVDYSLYNNFIYLSSAEKRLSNFQYKLGLLEEYQTSQSLFSNITGSISGSFPISSSNAILEFQVNDIIRNFDGYEYYLYYESSSTTWPKQNGNPPFILYSTTSSVGINWFNSQSLVAENYDKNNVNNLFYVIPEFIRDDSLNEPYVLFTNMVGQSFDNTWLYVKDLENRYNNDNRINFGISKDLVADALRSFGVKLYQNNFSSDDLYIALLGYNPEGGYLPPTGSELITTFVTSSAEPIPLEDVNYRTYKRIYNALPFLLKKKGTVDGLKALITIYGIPDTILRVSEFGGKDKINSNDWDFWQNKFNYAYDCVEAADFISSEFTLNSAWNTPYTTNKPETVAFRFKTPGVESAQLSRSQSLFVTNQGSLLSLEYSGSVNSSGSYSGSVVNPYNEYAFLKFYPDYNTNPQTSASLYLPFFDGGWWSTAITVNNTASFTLFAANNIYNGDDGSQIGFIASQSVNLTYTKWENSTQASFGNNFGSAFGGYGFFSGLFQEIRYFTEKIALSSFEDFTMNPDSIEATSWDGAPLELAFRASLGGELYTSSVSIHPKVTGSWIATSSFVSDSNFNIGNPSNFVPNNETIYFDQPIAGIRNIVSNKIHPISASLPAGDTLSRFIQIQQNSQEENNYTNNINYLEVAFSPQNEINEDIMDQMGFFNLGEYIGDPRQRFDRLDNYPDLDKLANSYFEKYTGNYNFTDYIRLIKYFDNSLFNMIKDFIPARTSLASGVVIKQNLLERSKYPQPLVTSSLNDFTGSIEMVFVTGGAGGSANNLNGLNTNPYYIANGLSNVYGVTQSWSESIANPYGLDIQIHSSQDEFYNGEFSGSYINTDNDGELNLANLAKQVSTIIVNYQITGSNDVNPGSGQIFYSLGNPPGGNPLAGDQFVDELLINEIDTNGLNIQEAISNLNPGDTITFPIQYELTFVPVNKIITGIITDVSPVGTTIWRVRLGYTTGDNGTDISYNALADIFNFSDTSGNINLNPFLNNIGNWNSNDYNATMNNALENRLNTTIQEVNYATSQNIPVNFGAIISGSAYPASIPDSNYTSVWWSGIRYYGVKNTTDNFNSSSISESLNVQNYQNDNIGVTTLGEPSVNLFDAGLLQFNWGGGSYPEIQNSGILNLNKLILVAGDKDAVSNYGAEQPGFLTSSAQEFPINLSPTFFQFSTNVTTITNTKIVDYGYSVPSVANYFIPFNQSSSAVAEVNGNGFTFSSSTNQIRTTSTNTSGNYVTSSFSQSASSVVSEIAGDLALGERWFISSYYQLISPIQGTLRPQFGTVQQLNTDPNQFVLEKLGVYEIVGTSGNTTLILEFNTGLASETYGGGGDDNGCLIWKASQGQFMLLTGNTLSGLGKGVLLGTTPSPVIIDNLSYIVEKSINT